MLSVTAIVVIRKSFMVGFCWWDKSRIYLVFLFMVIERTNNEVIFRLPADIDTASFERIVNYLKYKEAIRKSEGTDEQANKLADESKKRWWTENKNRFIK